MVADTPDVDKNKEEAESLPVSRITTTGREGASSSAERIHAVKGCVNYIDRGFCRK